MSNRINHYYLAREILHQLDTNADGLLISSERMQLDRVIDEMIVDPSEKDDIQEAALDLLDSGFDFKLATTDEIFHHRVSEIRQTQRNASLFANQLLDGKRIAKQECLQVSLRRQVCQSKEKILQPEDLNFKVQVASKLVQLGEQRAWVTVFSFEGKLGSSPLDEFQAAVMYGISESENVQPDAYNVAMELFELARSDGFLGETQFDGLGIENYHHRRISGDIALTRFVFEEDGVISDNARYQVNLNLENDAGWIGLTPPRESIRKEYKVHRLISPLPRIEGESALIESSWIEITDNNYSDGASSTIMPFDLAFTVSTLLLKKAAAKLASDIVLKGGAKSFIDDVLIAMTAAGRNSGRITDEVLNELAEGFKTMQRGENWARVARNKGFSVDSIRMKIGRLRRQAFAAKRGKGEPLTEVEKNFLDAYEFASTQLRRQETHRIDDWIRGLTDPNIFSIRQLSQELGYAPDYLAVKVRRLRALQARNPELITEKEALLLRLHADFVR